MTTRDIYSSTYLTASKIRYSQVSVITGTTGGRRTAVKPGRSIIAVTYVPTCARSTCHRFHFSLHLPHLRTSTSSIPVLPPASSPAEQPTRLVRRPRSNITPNESQRFALHTHPRAHATSAHPSLPFRPQSPIQQSDSLRLVESASRDDSII